MNTDRMTDEEVAGWHEAMRFASPPSDSSPVERVLQDHLRARREERMKDDRIHALEVQQADLLRQLAELRKMHSQLARLHVEREETIKSLADALEWVSNATVAETEDDGGETICHALRLVGRIK